METTTFDFGRITDMGIARDGRVRMIADEWKRLMDSEGGQAAGRFMDEVVEHCSRTRLGARSGRVLVEDALQLARPSRPVVVPESTAATKAPAPRVWRNEWCLRCGGPMAVIGRGPYCGEC